MAPVRAWTVLPDHASVNWHEDGAADVLLSGGIGVAAGIFSGTGAAARFRASALPAALGPGPMLPHGQDGRAPAGNADRVRAARRGGRD